jgi:hypothetical protein
MMRERDPMEGIAVAPDDETSEVIGGTPGAIPRHWRLVDRMHPVQTYKFGQRLRRGVPDDGGTGRAGNEPGAAPLKLAAGRRSSLVGPSADRDADAR